MPATTATTSTTRKRERSADLASPLPDVDGGSPADPALPAAAATPAASASATSSHASTNNFRNVSACDRCRNRKNRCDQKLPRCTNCQKAKAKCVGFDPVSKRKIPRSYVYYLESRVWNLEDLLRTREIPVPPPEEDFAINEAIRPGVNVPFPILDEEGGGDDDAAPNSKPARLHIMRDALDPALERHDSEERQNVARGGVGVSSSIRARPDPQLQPSARSVSFNRIVMEAVTTSAHVPLTISNRTAGSKNAKQSLIDVASGSASTARDTFFGLYTKPSIKGAPFPDRELGQRLVDLYFEHANPQIPVLHRNEFQALFEVVYRKDEKKRTPRELYLLNIVFAIGSGIIMDSSGFEATAASAAESPGDTSESRSTKRLRTASQQHQPEEYHASAIVHVKSFLSSPPTSEGVSGGLEELQAMLLLAGLALLRPVAPGLWYIIGQAVRLSIDLGLHFEEVDLDLDLDFCSVHEVSSEQRQADFGHKQWVRDLRRRLWWCVFNMDRLVSSCVGRPISISESVVTTGFPSMLDDNYITKSGFTKSPNTEEAPSYKLVSRHYLHLRLLQSEIMQVLQHQHADRARHMGAGRSNPYELESPFLQNFASFRDWRKDIDRRLVEWKDSAPAQTDSGVAFNPLFLELNYWQAVIMLYKQSLSVPEPLASELSVETGEEIQSPSARLSAESEEDKMMVFDKVAFAGHMVLKIYRTLHRDKLVNYTFLATHHLFMSGISFLYAIWHSPFVRSRLTEEEVDLTVLAGASVLSGLAEKCPPAAACRRAFERMSQVTIAMVMRTTGFGRTYALDSQVLHHHSIGGGGRGGYFGRASRSTENQHHRSTVTPPQAKRIPKFDYDLRGLFSEEEMANHQTTQRLPERSVLNKSSMTSALLQHRNFQAQQRQQQQDGAGLEGPATFHHALHRQKDGGDDGMQQHESLYRTTSQQQPRPSPLPYYDASSLSFVHITASQHSQAPTASSLVSATDSRLENIEYDSTTTAAAAPAFSDVDPEAAASIWADGLVGDVDFDFGPVTPATAAASSSFITPSSLEGYWDFTSEDFLLHPFFFGDAASAYGGTE